MREIYQIAQNPSQPGSYTTIGSSSIVGWWILQDEGSGELQPEETLKSAADALRDVFGDDSLRFVIVEDGEVVETEEN